MASARRGLLRAVETLEHRVLPPDKSIGWTLSRAVPILDANQEVVEWFGAASDIAQRKAAEVALARSEAFARSVVESSADCVKGLSLDGRLLWMNVNGQRQMEVSDITAIEGCDWANFCDAGGLQAEAKTALAAAVPAKWVDSPDICPRLPARRAGGT